ncbi:MAG: carbamoyltransferase [Chitinophagaceae bacterium]|nr:MAG: carbamoyltransferase [Chitinophagaceae bacterium]
MIVLGINAYHADSSAAIFVDGKMIAATEEERFRRIKHWAGFPSKAIEFCLKEANITIHQVDHIAIGRDPKAKFLKKLVFFATRPIESFVHTTERLLNQKKVSSIEQEFATHFGIDANQLKNKIHQVEHHRSHLASAFFASHFDNAAIVSIDGSGDFSTTMLAVGRGNAIEVFDSIDFPHSLGIFYTAFTQLLGFPYYGDEYKVMGLAPYGEAKYVDQLRDVVKTGLDNLCLAGGVAQNSVANGKILQNTPFKNIYIPSAGHDAGIAMGSAQYAYHHELKQARVPAIWSAYTGAQFTNEYIEQMLNQKNIPYKRLSDEELFEYVANRLINAGVVGWFNGRAEFGPRALGARSILADPSRQDAKELINSKIKRRESFRPFAPSILKEYVGEYFESSDIAPFMEKVYPIRKEKRSIIPAVTHADGSGRLQTVDQTISPRYYALIEAFRKKSGIPILLNTSFNENEPIVNSPEEALDCYLRTSMDMLVMENIIVERK